MSARNRNFESSNHDAILLVTLIAREAKEEELKLFGFSIICFSTGRLNFCAREDWFSKKKIEMGVGWK